MRYLFDHRRGECSPGAPPRKRTSASLVLTGRIAALLALVSGAADAVPRFTEQTATAGLMVRNVCGGPAKRHILEAHGAGAAWLDVDDDGRLDLYLVNGSTADSIGRGPGNHLFRNAGDGSFTDVTANAGVGDRGWGAGVAVGDADGDGAADLYVTNYGANVLYRGTGDGSFAEVDSAAGAAGHGYSASAAFFDGDGDGDLDLYVTNYVVFSLDDVPADPAYDEPCIYLGGVRVYCGPQGMVGGGDRLYRNDGGRFVDVTDSSGVAAANDSYGLGIVPADFDGDGRTDLFVANDETANVLFRNDGGLRFTDVAVMAGVAFNGDGEPEAGMGVDAADIDHDGDPDLHVTNFYGETNTLYRNDGDWLFTDATLDAGLGAPTLPLLGWGTHFLDVDLDGHLDLFVANGHVYPQVDASETGARYAQPNQLFLGGGDGTFVDVSADAGPGLAVRKVSRGSAVGDYDGDGDPDLFVVNLDDTPTLLRNDTAEVGNWLGVHLVDVSGRAVDGSRVAVTAVNGVQTRAWSTAGGYLGANESLLRFGLGEATTARVRVDWPDGSVTEVDGLASARVHDLRHPGAGEAR
jgi:hypothetical protein